MALIFHDGFETGGAEAWDDVIGPPTFVGTHPKTGSYEMHCDTSNSQAYCGNSGSAAMRATVYIYIASAPDVDCRILSVAALGSTAVFLTTARKLSIHVGTGEKDVGDTVLDLATWYRVSLSVDGDNGKVYLNGIEECSATDINFDYVSQDIGVMTSCTADLYFDDFAADDTVSTADMGDIRTVAARPNGEGTDQDVGSGEDWQDLSENPATYDHIDSDPPNTTDYNWAEADGVIMRYTVDLQSLSDLGISGKTIKAVNFMWYYKTGGGGSINYGKATYDQGARTVALIEDPKDPTWVSGYEVDCPSDGDPWTEAVFDECEMGMLTDDANKDLWFFEAYAMVAYDAAVGGADIQRTIDDDLGVTDSETIVRTVIRVIAESLGITDADSKVHEAIRTIAESLGITDDEVITRGIIRIIAESLGIIDDETAERGIIRTIVESIGVTDVDTRVTDTIRAIAESMGITDVRTKDLMKVIAESLGLTDTVDGIKGIIRTIADSMGITDSETRVCIVIRVIAESMGITDTASRIHGVYRIIAESMGITDSVDRVALVERIITETLNLTDVIIKDEEFVLSESMGIIDVIAKDEELVLSESLGITDSITRICIVVRTIAESMGITDDVPRVWEIIRTLTESLGLTDVVIPVEGGGADIFRTVDDALGMTDAASRIHIALRVLSENLGLTDAIVKIFAINRLVSDSINITDGTVLSRLIIVTDSLGITDSVTRLIDYIRTQDDDIGLIDSMIRVAIAIRIINENLGIVDSSARLIDYIRTQDDGVGLTDLMTRLIAVARTVDESMGITDDVTKLIDYVRTQDDDVGLVDSVVKVIDAIRIVNESMGITDEVSEQLGALIKAAWAFMIMRQTHN